MRRLRLAGFIVVVAAAVCGSHLVACGSNSDVSAQLDAKAPVYDPAREPELRAALDTAYELFDTGEVDAVDVVYTEFISAVNQTVKTERLLPAGLAVEVEDELPEEALFEPNTETVLEAVVYRLIGAQLFQALLDARASEHSMRMMAMKNATDNASDLIDDLTLAMNKARQGAITQELAEISGGAEAMK